MSEKKNDSASDIKYDPSAVKQNEAISNIVRHQAYLIAESKAFIKKVSRCDFETIGEAREAASNLLRAMSDYGQNPEDL